MAPRANGGRIGGGGDVTGYHIEVLVGDEWKRMHTAYRTREAANSWRKFVKAYWYATRSRVVAVEYPNAKVKT